MPGVLLYPLLQGGGSAYPLIVGYIIAIMFMAAMGAKSLGASIVASVGILMVYPNEDYATAIFLLYVPAYLLAQFRD